MTDNDDPKHDEHPAEPGFLAPLDEGDDADLDDVDDIDGAEDDWDDAASVFVLCARQPFEDWVRGVRGEGADWKLRPIDCCHAIITPELPTQEDADAWLQQNFVGLFAGQLARWTADEAAWPDASFDTFLAWFDVVFAPTVDDVRGVDAEPRPAVTCAPLSLRQVLAQFLQLPPDGSLHVDVETGELFAWTDDELEAIHAGDAGGFGVDGDDMRELQEAFASESLVEIAHRADLDEVDVMGAFAATVESQTVRNRLLSAMLGKKARRRFTEAIDHARLRNRWTLWLERAAADTLRGFLNDRGVPYVDDLESAEPDVESQPVNR